MLGDTTFKTLKEYLENYVQKIPNDLYRYRLTRNEIIAFIELDDFFKSKDDILEFMEKQLSKVKNQFIVFSYIAKYNIYREEFLFERIFDIEYINFIIEWGLVMYSTQDLYNNPRTGKNPLRIKATDIIGRSRTDIIISESDAHRIHGSKNNLKLLRECRLAVIFGP